LPENEKQLMFYKVAVCMLEASNKEGVRLNWGGNWSSWIDRPHFEIRN